MTHIFHEAPPTIFNTSALETSCDSLKFLSCAQLERSLASWTQTNKQPWKHWFCWACSLCSFSPLVCTWFSLSVFFVVHAFLYHCRIPSWLKSEHFLVVKRFPQSSEKRSDNTSTSGLVCLLPSCKIKLKHGLFLWIHVSWRPGPNRLWGLTKTCYFPVTLSDCSQWSHSFCTPNQKEWIAQDFPVSSVKLFKRKSLSSYF